MQSHLYYVAVHSAKFVKISLVDVLPIKFVVWSLHLTGTLADNQTAGCLKD